MKRNSKFLLIGLLFLLVVPFVTLAQDLRPVQGLNWRSPTLMAQGGSAGAVWGGYDALFTNPAAFAAPKGEFTLLSLGVDTFLDPFALMDTIAASGGEFSTDLIIDAALEQVLSTSLGVGTQVGLGFVGKGFGFGFTASVDALLPKADTILGATVDIGVTAAMPMGYSYRFPAGPLRISVGADVRPTVKVFVPGMDVQTAMGFATGDMSSDEILSSIDAIYAGWGIGFDAGATVEWSILRGSLYLRDIAHTRYQIRRHSVETLQQDPLNGGTEAVDQWVTPMTLGIGIAIDPEWRFFDPVIHAEYVQPFGTEEMLDEAGYGSFFTRLNLGAEVKLLNMIALRAGLNGGYFTTGLGLDLFLFEVNAAIWGQEMGYYLGEEPTIGMAVEFAMRY